MVLYRGGDFPRCGAIFGLLERGALDVVVQPLIARLMSCAV